MPVAEMPSEPRQASHVRRARLDQRLGRRHHFHQPAVVEQQQIVGPQARRPMQVNLEDAAFDASDGDFLRAALGLIEDHGIDDRPIMAVGGGKDAGGARHVLGGAVD